jgi:putative FmdB family regulatory protein
VPTYEYKCEQCGNIFEVRHSMNENPGVLCPKCKSGTQRIITGGSGFILKTKGTSSISDSQGTKCGKEQTCCGKETPCEVRPCDK